MDNWTEVLIELPTEFSGKASDIVSMAAPAGFYLEDYSDLEQGAWEIAHIDLIDEELLQKDRSIAIIHLYLSREENPAEALAFLRERFSAAHIPFTLATQTVHEEDWANNWKQYFKPIETGERLVICPEWEDCGSRPGRRVLRIDPGMAFGTGGHYTTRLCLEMMEQVIAPGVSLLDIGCGSGILSIAALLLGASRAVGIDIDPLAVKTAEENARLNGLSAPEFIALAGDLVDHVDGQYNVVMSNIVADAIISLAPQVGAHLAPDGAWITSGIIESREADVLAAFEQCGMTVLRRSASGGWLCFLTKKKTI